MLSIAFYHLGVCYENEYNNKMSHTLYEQSKYFDSQNNSGYQEESNFGLFMDNLIIRTNLRDQLITFFSVEEKKKNILHNVIDIPRTVFSSNEYNNKKKEKRYERVKYYIENLKIVELDDIVRSREACGFVIGMPYQPDGTEGDTAHSVRLFARRLEEKFGLPIFFIDERLSSSRAEGFMMDIGMRRNKIKKTLDANVARDLLQKVLDMK
jgi:putative transcription antitermination factor YqgF